MFLKEWLIDKKYKNKLFKNMQRKRTYSQKEEYNEMEGN
jgi:hypothetical protein